MSVLIKGFCEFNDSATASSAVRNMNDYDIGGRRLRVNYAEGDNPSAQPPSASASSGPSSSTLPQQRNIQQQQQQQSNIGPSQATDAITALLGSMSSEQLFDVMSQMKSLVQSDPAHAKSLLSGNPQLTYGLFQALIIMKIIRPEIVSQVLQGHLQSTMPQQQQAPMPHQQPSPMNQQTQLPAEFANLPEAQKAALWQVMQMPDAQVNALPAEQRQQVLTLKAKLRNV